MDNVHSAHTKLIYPTYFNKFINYMEEKDYKDLTIKNYVSDLILFLKYIKYKEDGDKLFNEVDYYNVPLEKLGNISDEYILDYIDFSFDKRRNSDTTSSRKICSLDLFYSFLREEYEDINNDPVKIYDKIVDTRFKFKLMEDWQIELLLSNYIKSRYPYRDRLVAAILINTGIKLNELCNLKLADLQGDTLYIIKNDKISRKFKLSSYCTNLLKPYYRERGRAVARGLKKGRNVKVEYLFLGERGDRLGPRGVQRLLSNMGKSKLPFNKKCNPSMLRNTKAMKSIKEGMSSVELKEFLGNNSLSNARKFYLKR